MLPDMADVLAEWAAPYTVKTITRITLEFEPVNVVTDRIIRAVIQPAQKEKLNPDQIDWSKKYIQIHTTETLIPGELIVYGREDYKVIEPGDYQLYGFTEAIAEQTKQTLVPITP